MWALINLFTLAGTTMQDKLPLKIIIIMSLQINYNCINNVHNAWAYRFFVYLAKKKINDRFRPFLTHPSGTPQNMQISHKKKP